MPILLASILFLLLQASSATATVPVCSDGSGGPLTLGAGAHTLDTDTGMINGSPSAGWDGTAFHFTSIDLPAGATLRADGSQPLILLATDAVDISGVLDASGLAGGNGGAGCDDVSGGAGGLGGPAGSAGGAGGGSAPGTGTPNGANGLGAGGGKAGTVAGTDGAAGGGGAGHSVAGMTGFVGRPVGTPGSGGAAYASLPPLVGGSGGGGGSVEKDGTAGTLISDDDDGAGGGGGGGAVAISGAAGMTVPGTIDASGGAGGGADCDAGSGGGGSGGVIELLAATAPVVGGTLDVSGGTGGTSGPSPIKTGGDGSAGRTAVGVGPCGPALVATKRGDLFIDIDGDLQADPGDTLLYTIEITNTGAGAAVDIIYSDTPDPAADFVDGSVTTTLGTVATGNGAGDTTVVVDVGTLAYGDSVIITYEVDVIEPFPTAPLDLVNQGTVSGSNFDDVPTDDPTTAAADDETVVPVDAICDTAPSAGCRVNGSPPTVCRGTPGSDVIIGTSGNDTILGRGGNDYIVGGAGHDLLCGQGGADVLIGQGGRDRLDGGGGADLLQGGGGRDRLSGGGGNDDLRGDAGRDELDGGSGNNDRLQGGLGTDTCTNGEVVTGCEQ